MNPQIPKKMDIKLQWRQKKDVETSTAVYQWDLYPMKVKSNKVEPICIARHSGWQLPLDNLI